MIEALPPMSAAGLEAAMMPMGSDAAGGEQPWWEELSAHSDREDVRREIGGLIRSGEVTVRPRPGDPERVEVIPFDSSRDVTKPR